MADKREATVEVRAPRGARGTALAGAVAAYLAEWGIEVLVDQADVGHNFRVLREGRMREECLRDIGARTRVLVRIVYMDKAPK